MLQERRLGVQQARLDAGMVNCVKMNVISCRLGGATSAGAAVSSRHASPGNNSYMASTKRYFQLPAAGLCLSITLLACTQSSPGWAAGPPSATPANAAVATNGPLRVHPTNSRYFADAAGKAVYLTGMHYWYVFQDSGESLPLQAFDYAGYLDRMVALGHNHLRFWTWEHARWTTWGHGNYNDPMPYQRTGPGNALDGQPKFDLSRFNQAYFDRMRERVIQARDKGIYATIMFFNGWSVGVKGDEVVDNPWKGHPYNKANNINNINGDLNNDGQGYELHELKNPQALEFQKAFIRKVIDTVNDLDNVMYEISNESGMESVQWQYELIRFTRSYIASKPMKHLIAMTSPDWKGSNKPLYDSPADWFAPGSLDGFNNDPPPAQGGKPIMADTDHVFGIGGDATWIWKAFLRGSNTIFMDNLGTDEWEERIRVAMGKTREFALRMNLAATTPRGDLASTGYMLAHPGVTYLALNPDGGTITIDLSGTSNRFDVSWHDVNSGQTVNAKSVRGGGNVSLNPPFSGPAVVFLSAATPENQKPRAFVPIICVS